MRGYHRQKKIVATVGPANESGGRLREWLGSAVDASRLNLAHGTGEWVTALARRIREVSQVVERHVAVMMGFTPMAPAARQGAAAQFFSSRGVPVTKPI